MTFTSRFYTQNPITFFRLLNYLTLGCFLQEILKKKDPRNTQKNAKERSGFTPA